VGRSSLRTTTLLLIALAALLPAAIAHAQPDADRTLRSAHGLLERGLDEQAIPEYETLLRDHPSHPEADSARYGLGVCRYRRAEFDQAIEALSDIGPSGSFPFAFEASLIRADCLLHLDRAEEAATMLGRLLSASPDHAASHQAAALLVEALGRMGEHRRVVDAAARATDRWPGAPGRDRIDLLCAMSLAELGRHAEAARVLEPLLGRATAPPIEAPAISLLAQSKEATGDLEAAARLHERVVEAGRESDRPGSLLALGRLERRAGRLDDARGRLEAFAEAYPTDPDAPAAALELALVHAEAGRHAEAREAARLALAGGDETIHDDAAYWSAKSTMRLGRHREAAGELEAALERFAESELRAEMAYDLGIALLRAGDDAEGAMALRRFRTSHPDHGLVPGALHAEAAVALGRGERTLARRLCSRLIDAHPDDPAVSHALFIRGEAAYLDGDYDDAGRDLAALLELERDPARADRARYRLGMTRFRQGRLDEARVRLERVAERDPLPAELTPALAALGEIAFGQEAWDEARSRLERYVEAVGAGNAAPAAMLRLGLSLARLDRCAEAIQRFDDLIAAAPGGDEPDQARYERALCLLELGLAAEAETALREIAEGGGGSRFAPHAMRRLGTLALDRGDTDEATAWFAAATGAGDPDVSLASAFDEARALLEAGDTRAALDRLDTLLRHRDLPEALRGRAEVARAIALSRGGRPGPALEAIDRLDLDRLDRATRRSLMFDRATLLRTLGNEDEARRTLGTLIDEPGERDEVRAHALLEAAAIDMDAGRHADAVALLDDLLGSGAPADRRVLEAATYRRGACAHGLGDHAGVVEALGGFRGGFPGSDLAPSADLLCGDALVALARRRDAAGYLERAAAPGVAPDVRGPALVRLGALRAGLQDWDGSRRAYASLLEAFPDHDQWYRARFGIGWALEQQGDHGGAIAAYREVARGHSGETAARAQFQIGECLFAMGDHERAVRELLRVEILYAYPAWSAAALYEAGRCFEAMNKIGEARAQYRRVIAEFDGSAWRDAAAERLERLDRSGLPGRGDD
jgi:TolA-binding protein